MMRVMKLYILLLLFVTANSQLAAQSLNDSVFQSAFIGSFQLTDAAHKKITTLGNLPAAQTLVLFIFLSPECPLCKNYMPVLNAVQQQYNETVKVIGIVPGRTYTATAVNAFVKKYKAGFLLFIDPQKKLTNYLHAAVTPEVILLNSQSELVYRGAIDNRVKALGIQKGQSTENYLTDAIAQYQQHTSIAVKRKQAIGCLINDF